MNALVRKELRQVLPALLLIAAAFAAVWLVIVPPDEALAPFHPSQTTLCGWFAIACCLVGLLCGLAQFGIERWQGTEAFLVHRATGFRGAFHGKVLAAAAALAWIAVLPPLVFGIRYFRTPDFAGLASVESLLQAVIAGTAVAPGYAVGVFAAQMRRGWFVRIAFALLAASTLMFVLLLLHWGAPSFPQALAARFVLLELAATALLLFLARRTFEAGPRPDRSRSIALLHAATAAALCLPVFTVLPAYVVAIVTNVTVFDYPHVVEDAGGRLYVARPVEGNPSDVLAAHPDVPRHGRYFALEDEGGRALPLGDSLYYRGLLRLADQAEDPDPKDPGYRTLYWGLVTTLTPATERDPWSDVRRGVAYGICSTTGPWIWGDDAPSDWDYAIELSSGTLWTRQEDGPDPRWQVGGRLDAGSLRALRPYDSLRGMSHALADAATGRLWSIGLGKSGRLTFLPAPLPEGDRFVEVEALYDTEALRCGLRGYGSHGDLVRGERDLYAFVDGRWVPWRTLDPNVRASLAVASQVGDLQRWTLSASDGDGFEYGLDVLDAATGQTRLSVEFAPTSPRALRNRRIAELACLAMPPVVALSSWASPARVASPTPTVHVGLGQLNLLRGQERTWIAIALLLLAAVLARDVWRRLGHGGAPTSLRLGWSALAALFGLPAYVLCRLLEPRSARAPRRVERRESPLPRFEIRTA